MATAEQTAADLKTLSPSDIAKALRLAAWDFDVIAANMEVRAVKQAWEKTATKLIQTADAINDLWDVDISA